MRKRFQTYFSRFEYKYLISKDLAGTLEDYFNRKCLVDSYNPNNKPYTVNSIYFDSPDFLFYHEKVDGYANRQKVRLRFYEEKYNGNSVFLEFKYKDLNKIYKERALLSKKSLGDIERLEFTGLKSDLSQRLNNKLIYLSQIYNLEPKVEVVYNRLSFYDGVINCKVSFDNNLKASQKLNVRSKSSFVPVLENYCIMEIKFSQMIPAYIIDVIRKYNLSRQAISKYCYAVDTVCAWPLDKIEYV